MTRLTLLASSACAALLLAACGGAEEADADTEADGAEMTSDDQVVADILEAVVADASASELRVADARACDRAGAEDADFTAPARAEGQADADYNAAVGQAFIAANASNPCVFTLDSGLQFRVDRVREGDSPRSGELVEVHYEGALIDGSVFDSSHARGAPAVFPSNRLIAGWVEALPLMNVGEAWTLFIPADLAYGPRGTPGGPIGPNETLVFRLELRGLPGRPDRPAPDPDDG